MDVTDGEAVQQAMARVVEELGGIDVLVSAAGILDETPLLEMTEATFDKVLAVDLKGVFLAARWAAPHMVERGGGRIINIASQLGIKGGTGLTHYVAAKAGVIGMTKAMALELAEHRILVNSIAPGPVVTPLIEKTAGMGTRVERLRVGADPAFFLSGAELDEYRIVRANYEVAETGNPNMSVEAARRAYVASWEMVSRIQEKYFPELEPDEYLTINAQTGRVFIDDEA